MGVDHFQRQQRLLLETLKRTEADPGMAEREKAEKEAARQFADSQMPDDIRSRARSWGMENWATVLWSNAFFAGYRSALRVRDKEEPND